MIALWISKQGSICPLTGQPLVQAELMPDHKAKEQIRVWHKDHMQRKSSTVTHSSVGSSSRGSGNRKKPAERGVTGGGEDGSGKRAGEEPRVGQGGGGGGGRGGRGGEGGEGGGGVCKQQHHRKNLSSSSCSTLEAGRSPVPSSEPGAADEVFDRRGSGDAMETDEPATGEGERRGRGNGGSGSDSDGGGGGGGGDGDCGSGESKAAAAAAEDIYDF